MLGAVVVALLVLMVAADVSYLGALLMSVGEPNGFVNVGLSQATQWIPAAVLWVVAARSPSSRLPLVLAALGTTFNALGDTYYSLAMDADGFLAFPSPADAAYLLFYPLLLGALIAHVRGQLREVGRLMLLEAAVATVGASAVLAVILDPVIVGAFEGESVVATVIAAAYPLFDLLILAVLAGIASMPGISTGRRSWALSTGLSLFVVADVVYALLENDDAYLAGTPLDATWAIGLAFITWWAAGVPRALEEPAGPRPRLGVPLPAFAVVAGLVVLIVGTQVALSTLAVTLAAVTVGLGAVPIVFRQAVLGRMLAAQEESVRRLTELDQAKTDLMVTMNHEFRTPLTSINGHVELLLDGGAGSLPPAATGMLETIERNGARLQSLIDETLTASRLEEGQDFFVRAPLDVTELVSRAVERFEPFARSRDVELVGETDGRSHVIDADGGHLERAVANLIANAVKFSHPGGRVTVSLAAPPGGDDLVLRVHDTGIGIPADDIPRLFTRFFRASNVQSAAIPGVGLGLFISRQIVRAHGGSIAVSSNPDDGTTMTVRLPLRAEARGARSTRGRRTRPRQSSTSPST